MSIITKKDLKETLGQTLNISSIDIEKLYEEILSFFSEDYKTFSIRRHKELKNQGFNNNEIYNIIIDEIKNRLFKGPSLTQRQIKRIIYKEK